MCKVCPKKIPIENGEEVCWLQKDPKINPSTSRPKGRGMLRVDPEQRPAPPSRAGLSAAERVNGERRHCGKISEDRACEPRLVAIDEYAFMGEKIIDQKCIQLKYMRKPEDIPFIYRIKDEQKLHLFQKMARLLMEGTFNRARLRAKISRLYPQEARHLDARLEHLEIGVAEAYNTTCLCGNTFFMDFRSPKTNTRYNVWIVGDAGKGNEFKMIDRLLDLIQMGSEAVFPESF